MFVPLGTYVPTRKTFLDQIKFTIEREEIFSQ